MTQGKVVQIVGPVVDVVFSRDEVPRIFDALTLEDGSLVLEVQQELGDGVVPVSYTHLTLPTIYSV